MNKTPMASIMFTCPQCNANFEFDAVGPNEFVPCPLCGAHFVSAQKGKKLVLETVMQAQICCQELAIMG